DSIWAARLLLPLGTDLAEGTLRALARRQGTRYDPVTEQQPGKIPHEIRSTAIDTGQVRLSSLYYGTVDATPLWVCLLHEAWLAGMPEDRVRELLPNLAAAMGWITGPDGDPDGDGLLEYLGSTTGGLTNQGWKDSHDAVRHVDGRYPRQPLALCEVQGYAYAAALAAADLARAFDRPGATAWTDWAGGLRTRFHESFWIDDQHGRFPAIALDADKKPVGGAASNMAHLLGTGILNAEQAGLVAARIGLPDLTSPFGLRTLSGTSRMYNPFSYHLGSVWPHDSAIAMIGMAAEGQDELAHRLAEGILRAAGRFGGHTPELYAVLDESPVPLAYPAACSPQAWSAAGVVRAALLLDIH
nr:amylo-alpha-1,6-glucosidase [Actinomycetota bacterium]